jgi:putative addiction module component (TIGR02574 family)
MTFDLLLNATIASLIAQSYIESMNDAAIIENEALQLTPIERARLADRLIQSISQVPEDLHDQWVAESDDRMNAYRTGEIEAVDGPDAIAQLRAKIG